MHLINILNALKASEDEKNKLIDFFKSNVVSYSSVEKELIKLEKAGTSGIVVTGELSIVGLTNEFL